MFGLEIPFPAMEPEMHKMPKVWATPESNRGFFGSFVFLNHNEAS